MFGKQDDKPVEEAADDALDKLANDIPAAEDSESGQPADQPSEPEPDEPGTAAPETGGGDIPETVETPAKETVAQPDGSHDDTAWQHPGTALGGEKGNEQITDIISPAGGYPKRTSYQYGAVSAGSPDNDSVDHELIDIKHQALGELSPLVDQLDLPPEEKFQAIMMILQDSDDQALVKAAFDTAHSIKDEKTRGLALLSIVNEINYFTQQPVKSDEDQ